MTKRWLTPKEDLADSLGLINQTKIAALLCAALPIHTAWKGTDKETAATNHVQKNFILKHDGLD